MQKSNTSTEDISPELRVHSGNPADIIIRTNHSDETRYLSHILKEMQTYYHRRIPNGEVYSIQFTLTAEAPPTFMDFEKRYNNINVPTSIRVPDAALFGIRILNMGTPGTPFTGTGLLYYSLNMPSIEGGTVVMPPSSSAHRYIQGAPVYKTINLRATTADLVVNLTLET